MICAVGCVSPAIGIANLKSLTMPYKGVYPLCRWHYDEVLNGTWAVELEGWEALPGGEGQTGLDLNRDQA